uniref:Alpha-1,3-glucosyltransferase n=1 Tax=Strongyloides stercoralis TaxID=6248 RepID=A0AAF5DBW2_STRER
MERASTIGKQDAEILLIPHVYFDVPTYAPLSPPLTQYDYEALYYDPSQYFLYRSDLMTEAELPSHIYEWPKRKQSNKLGIINVDTNHTNIMNDYFRSSDRYSPSVSAVISMESSPKDSTDTAAPSPIPMETEERCRRTVIGGEMYNCPRIPPICCKPTLFGELRSTIDYNVFNRPWISYSERGFPYNSKHDYEQINWNVVEDYFLFKSIVIDQNIRSVDFNTSRCRETPNWLPARQCHLRYLHSIMPKEEGKDQVYDLIGKKVRKVQVSAAEHSFRKRHGKKRLEEFYLHDAKKILKLSIAAEAKVIVSKPLVKYDFHLVPTENVDYTEFSDTMNKHMIERLNFRSENRFSIKDFSDPSYKLKNWIKNDLSQSSKPPYIDSAFATMNKRVKEYQDRVIPFKKTPLCVGNNNAFLDPVNCTTIERIDFNDINVFRQQPPVTRPDYTTMVQPRTIQISRRPLNISGSQINVNQTPQLMPMTYRSGGLTISNTGQGNTPRYIQADINHQRRFSVQSSRTGTLSQSSSTSSNPTTIQQYHLQGTQKQQQQQTKSPINVQQPQQQQTTSSSSQPQYHSSVMVNSGDRGIPRIASFQYVQSQNHPTPQNVTRPPVRTMYPAGTGRKVHQMPTSRIQGSGNFLYGMQGGHPGIVKTVSTHRIITKPSSSSQQHTQQQQQQQQQSQQQQQPHQQAPPRLSQTAGPFSAKKVYGCAQK